MDLAGRCVPSHLDAVVNHAGGQIPRYSRWRCCCRRRGCVCRWNRRCCWHGRVARWHWCIGRDWRIGRRDRCISRHRRVARWHWCIGRDWCIGGRYRGGRWRRCAGRWRRRVCRQRSFNFGKIGPFASGAVTNGFDAVEIAYASFGGARVGKSRGGSSRVRYQGQELAFSLLRAAAQNLIARLRDQPAQSRSRCCRTR